MNPDQGIRENKGGELTREAVTVKDAKIYIQPVVNVYCSNGAVPCDSVYNWT